MQGYIAILCKEPDTAWGVHFPDLLGCTSVGNSMAEAVENAGRALRLWGEDETELPKASTLDALRKRPDVREDLASGGMAVYVPLIVAERKQLYNAMLDPSLVEGIDLAAKTAGVSRSDFIAYAATQTLETKTGAVTIARGRVRSRARRAKERAQANAVAQGAAQRRRMRGRRSP